MYRDILDKIYASPIDIIFTSGRTHSALELHYNTIGELVVENTVSCFSDILGNRGRSRQAAVGEMAEYGLVERGVPERVGETAGRKGLIPTHSLFSAIRIFPAMIFHIILYVRRRV
jgi:hypothetical protein